MAGRGRDIVVIGASAGVLEAMTALLRQLPADLPAAVFAVTHLLPHGRSHLADALNAVGPLLAKTAEDGEAIERGKVYVAPPDRHLLVKSRHVRVTRGPRENRWRPAIDPLFRTAAVAHGTHVIGVVLTGMLDDGTAGLAAIKRCGGVAIVQDPEEAAYPEMPQTALANVAIDYKVPLEEMGPLIDRLTREPVAPRQAPPRDLAREAKIAETGYSDAALNEELGELSALTCPECGGPLWQRTQGEPGFRCRVGHAYGFESLLGAGDDALEVTLWAAVRLFEQRAHILSSMAKNATQRRDTRLDALHERMASEARAHADALREFIMRKELPEDAHDGAAPASFAANATGRQA